MTYPQKFKVNGQSVLKTEWKQVDQQTDGGDCITSLANVVNAVAINYVCDMIWCKSDYVDNVVS